MDNFYNIYIVIVKISITFTISNNDKQIKIMRTASWVIVENTTGNAILETYSESIAKQVNTEKYTAMPVMDYLCKLNKKIKNN